MNKVIMMGRLTRDPEIRNASNGTAVASFSIAVDRRFKRDGEPEADFFNCTAFGKQAEFVEKYLKKGIKVVLEGRIQNENYEKDGEKKTVVKIYVDGIEFAESKAASQNSTSTDPSVSKADKDGFMNIPDDLDLPFA